MPSLASLLVQTRWKVKSRIEDKIKEERKIYYMSKTLISNGNVAKLSLPVNTQRDHIRGEASAPVTLVEYRDYECPYCGQAYPIVKEIQKRLKKIRRVLVLFLPALQSLVLLAPPQSPLLQ